MKELTRLSMMLINSLLAHVNDTRWEEFIGELDRLNVRKAVVVRSSHQHYYARNLLMHMIV